MFKIGDFSKISRVPVKRCAITTNWGCSSRWRWILSAVTATMPPTSCAHQPYSGAQGSRPQPAADSHTARPQPGCRRAARMLLRRQAEIDQRMRQERERFARVSAETHRNGETCQIMNCDQTGAAFAGGQRARIIPTYPEQGDCGARWRASCAASAIRPTNHASPSITMRSTATATSTAKSASRSAARRWRAAGG